MSDDSEPVGFGVGPMPLIHPDCVFCRDGRDEGWEVIHQIDPEALQESISEKALLRIVFHAMHDESPVCDFSFRVERWKSEYGVIIVPHQLPPAWERVRLQQLIIPGHGSSRISQGTRFLGFFREGYGPSGPRSRVYLPVAHIAIKKAHVIH